MFRWAVRRDGRVAQPDPDASGIRAERPRRLRPAPGEHAHHRRDGQGAAPAEPSVVVARDIATTGNTSAASIPLALDRLLAEGAASSGRPRCSSGSARAWRTPPKWSSCPDGATSHPPPDTGAGAPAHGPTTEHRRAPWPSPSRRSSRASPASSTRSPGTPVADVTSEKSFVDDLDIDSLSMVEVVMAAEDKFGVTIPDSEVKNLDHRRRRRRVHRQGERLGADDLPEAAHRRHRPGCHRPRSVATSRRPGSPCSPGRSGIRAHRGRAVTPSCRYASPAPAAVDPSEVLPRVEARKLDRNQQLGADRLARGVGRRRRAGGRPGPARRRRRVRHRRAS